jgi:hypothetical protein
LVRVTAEVHIEHCIVDDRDVRFGAGGEQFVDPMS